MADPTEALDRDRAGAQEFTCFSEASLQEEEEDWGWGERVVAPQKTAPRETELPSEEQRVAEDGSRNHRGEGGRVEKRSLGAKRGWRALQDSHRSLEDKGIYPT